MDYRPPVFLNSLMTRSRCLKGSLIDKEGERSEEEVEGEEGEVLEGGEGADDDEHEEAPPPPPPKTMTTVTGVSPTLVTY
jgi:hypothetical protein